VLRAQHCRVETTFLGKTQLVHIRYPSGIETSGTYWNYMDKALRNYFWIRRNGTVPSDTLWSCYGCDVFLIDSYTCLGPTKAVALAGA
jgi:hypothetical protein